MTVAVGGWGVCVTGINGVIAYPDEVEHAMEAKSNADNIIRGRIIDE